ncbi:MAG: hypothetical protein P8Z30_13585 [Acidobacteriota bacterium]
MKGLLSLDQELRAARRAKGQKNATRPNHTPDPKETERPWQPDIALIQQTMREVLRAVAGLSGVELPGLPPGLQDDGAPPPRLDIKTLKDRFRNDLEGFSIKTTEELTKQAKERTHAALDAAVQNELSGRIDQVAVEFREQLQLPGQIEKLLEPSVKEAVAKLETSLTQKVERMFAEREQLAQDKLQAAPSPVQAQVSTVEETAARLERSLTQKVEQLFTEREQLIQARLQETQSSAQAQVSAVEEAAARLERSLSQKVEQLFAEREQVAQERLQRALSPVQAQVSTVEQAAARLETSLFQKVERLFAEREQLVQERVQAAPSSVQAPGSTVEEAAARLERSLSQKVERVFAEREQVAQDRLQGSLSSIQAQIRTLEQTVQQVRELKVDSVAQLSVDRSNAAADNAMKKYESSPNNELNGFLDQAFSRIKWSLNNFVETPKIQPVQSTVAGLEERSKGIPFNNADMESRVQQALEQLGRLGSKNPHAPAR